VKKCIIWLRKDLRLHDHPGFAEAIEKGYELVPIYLWDTKEHRWQEAVFVRTFKTL